MENESSPSPEAATEVAPEATSLQAAPSMPFEQTVPNSAFGSAAQFLLRDSQAQNAAALSLQPQVVSGNDIRFTGQQLTFAPNGLYFISLLLSAQVGTSGFGEIIPQIAGALRREYAAYAQHLLPVGDGGTLLSFFAQHCRPAAASFARAYLSHQCAAGRPGSGKPDRLQGRHSCRPPIKTLLDAAFRGPAVPVQSCS